MFKVFPCAGKVPLIKDWANQASSDPEKHAMWANLYREKLTHWGVPTGPINDILVLDVDVKGNGYETLKSYSVPDTLSQRTPSGGTHYFFKYPKDGKRYGNRASKREDRFLGSGIDARGEGGYVCWYNTAESKPMVESPGWFTGAYQSVHNPETPAGQPVQTIKVSPEIAQRVVETSLETVRNAADGERNHTLNIESFRLGQMVAAGSLTFEYAFGALLRGATLCGLPEHEARATISSGLSGGHKKPITDPFGAQAPSSNVPIPSPHGPKWTPERTTMEELFDHTKLRKPQLFQDWSTEDIHLTTADGGTGKTTLKLFEAVCLALGERFLGFNCVQPGRTLFITGEDTDKKLKAMLGKILKEMGLTESPAHNEKVQKVLDSIYIKKDADFCLIVKDLRTGFLTPNPAAMAQILQAIEEIRPKMIVFDPISSFWGSESALNDMAKAVSKFMAELVERSGACVEMINHMGKQSSGQKDMSQFAGRGGSGLPSHSRVVRTLRSVSDQEYSELTSETLTEKQSAMLCNVAKFSDGSPLYNKEFLILRDGFIFSRKEMTEAKAREAEQKLTDVERVFQYIKEVREKNKFPSRAAITAFFKTNGNPIIKSRVEAALEVIETESHMGDFIKLVHNPDEVKGGKVYVICDSEGRES